MIRNFPQRMRRLSEQFAQQGLAMRLDEQGRTPAQAIRERPLQLAAEREGRAPEMPQQRQVPDAPSERPPQTLSEVIRVARLKKRLEQMSTPPKSGLEDCDVRTAGRKSRS